MSKDRYDKLNENEQWCFMIKHHKQIRVNKEKNAFYFIHDREIMYKLPFSNKDCNLSEIMLNIGFIKADL